MCAGKCEALSMKLDNSLSPVSLPVDDCLVRTLTWPVDQAGVAVTMPLRVDVVLVSTAPAQITSFYLGLSANHLQEYALGGLKSD
jgi:hypothetical protein